jgi:hypothetical protein
LGTYSGLVIASVSRFSVGFSQASEFEVFPQAATLPQEEETTFDF